MRKSSFDEEAMYDVKNGLFLGIEYLWVRDFSNPNSALQRSAKTRQSRRMSRIDSFGYPLEPEGKFGTCPHSNEVRWCAHNQ